MVISLGRPSKHYCNYC